MIARTRPHGIRVGTASPAGASLLALCACSPLAEAATSRTVNNTTDPAAGTASKCNPGNAGTCSLRDAIAAVSSGDAINNLRITGFGSAALDKPQTLWNCTSGINCTHAVTVGPLDDTISLPPLASVTWHVGVPVIADTPAVTATLKVRTEAAGGASDVDALAISRSGFEAVSGT